MLYIFAAVVFAGCLIFYLRTPAHDRLGRFFFRLGMIGAVLVAVLGWLVFNVLLRGADKM
ncbi:MAG: hypothetical protein RLT05_32075 [Bauldia litoralis]